MKTIFNAAMRQATKLTLERNVIEATRMIQRALSGQDHAVSPGGQSPKSSRSFKLQAPVAAGRSRGLAPRRTPELRALALGTLGLNGARKGRLERS